MLEHIHIAIKVFGFGVRQGSTSGVHFSALECTVNRRELEEGQNKYLLYKESCKELAENIKGMDGMRYTTHSQLTCMKVSAVKAIYIYMHI